MDRVALNRVEAEWIFRNVLKMTQLLEVTAAKRDPKVVERSTYKTLKGMIPKIQVAVELPDESIHIMLNRKQKLILRELISSVHKTLVERVIPEYERRGETHKEYLTNAHLKATVLSTMSRKLK